MWIFIAEQKICEMPYFSVSESPLQSDSIYPAKAICVYSKFCFLSVTTIQFQNTSNKLEVIFSCVFVFLYFHRGYVSLIQSCHPRSLESTIWLKGIFDKKNLHALLKSFLLEIGERRQWDAKSVLNYISIKSSNMFVGWVAVKPGLLGPVLLKFFLGVSFEKKANGLEIEETFMVV